MIKQLSISGLGPHLDFDVELDPRAVTTITGPSESGKSFITEAIAFALWGSSSRGKFQPEAIHDDADKASVEVTLDSGRVIRRSINRKKKQSRQIELAGETESFSSDKAFAAALGELTEDEEAVRVVIVPMAWQPLVASNARKFRDLLARVLPEGDVEGEIQRIVAEAGFEVSDEELQLEEKVVLKQRGQMRKQRDELSGRVQSAEERIAELEAALEEAASEAVEVDERLLARIEAWDAYDRETGAAGAHKAASQARHEWDRRREELGEEPELTEAHLATRDAAKAAQAEAKAARAAAQEAYGAYQVVQARLEGYGEDHDPSVCPTCSRPGWEEGARAHQALVAQAAEAKKALDAAQKAEKETRAAFMVAKEAVDAAREVKLSQDAWRQALAALGPRPELPELPADAAEPPEVERPSEEEVARVKDALAARQAAEGARKQREADLEKTRTLLERERAKYDEASKEADRLDVLLGAVRTAPSIVAAEQALALGDLGPVSLEFGDNPAVEVKIDGRPWWLASRGRQVVADTHLRMALRQVMELDHLPIIIDNVQDVGGQPLPDVPGPAFLLRTDDGKGLRVRKK